jgi:outer membrane protein assembly factor BamB
MQKSLPLLVASCFAATFLSAAASDWTRFRGPNGTGIADGKDIPVNWTAKNILWKAELPGIGNSSPIIWKDHLYLQTASKDAKERQLLCVSVKDGAILWKQSITAKALAGGKGTSAKIHEKSSYASSSAAVDAERVYVVFWDNVDLIMNAYTHSGQPLWSKNLGAFSSQHGAGASPIPLGDKVYFADDTDDKAVMLCLDAKTGTIVWSQERQHFRACYSAPFVRDLPGGARELIVLSTMGVTAYDPDTGSKRWNWDWDFGGKAAMRTTASPILSDDIVVVCSGDGAGKQPRHMVAVKVGPTPKKVWENLKDFPYVPTPLAWGKHLYFVNDKGFAGCFETATGKQMWFQRVSNDFTASPVLVDGKIYAVDEDGDVFVIAATPMSYQLLAKNSLGEMVRATPAVVDNRMYIRGRGHLFCIGKAD